MPKMFDIIIFVVAEHQVGKMVGKAITAQYVNTAPKCACNRNVNRIYDPA